jgi:hypothetical protein
MHVRSGRRSAGPGARSLITSVLLAALASAAGAQSVTIEFEGGKVNLVAKDAQARQILAEWARVGGTRIVNGERVPGPPISIELIGVDERRAIDVVLRNASGYMVSSRPAAAGQSILDTVNILPTSTVQRAAGTLPAPQPTAVQQAFGDDQDDDPPRPVVAGRGAPPRQTSPAVPAPPAPRQVRDPDEEKDEDEEEPEPARPATQPGNPFGVPTGSTRPGVITPPAQQSRPGQPATPPR